MSTGDIKFVNKEGEVPVMYHTGLWLVDFTSQLDAINKELPPGIKASLMLSGSKVYISYTVRYQRGTKKHSLGTFLTKDGAISAMIEHKFKGLTTKSDAELNAQMQLMMASAVKQMEDQIAEIAKPRESLTMETIGRLLLEVKGLHMWQVPGRGEPHEEHDIDVTDTDGVTYTITPQQQSDWLAWQATQG